uniref:hypothetical protein n=1 Tax=Polypodium hydriforme TaxID=43186 RepID=UPI0021148882|nr:hypothetical protein NQY43_mgp12 [Polypodium hydriforme]USZ79608.1 hypothetical protein [Polypodium hydriforme]
MLYFRSNVNRLVGYLAATWLLWLISIIVESGLDSSLHKLVVFMFALGALCPAHFLAFATFSIFQVRFRLDLGFLYILCFVFLLWVLQGVIIERGVYDCSCFGEYGCSNIFICSISLVVLGSTWVTIVLFFCSFIFDLWYDLFKNDI